MPPPRPASSPVYAPGSSKPRSRSGASGPTCHLGSSCILPSAGCALRVVLEPALAAGLDRVGLLAKRDHVVGLQPQLLPPGDAICDRLYDAQAGERLRLRLRLDGVAQTGIRN